ncbi:MAG: 4Fe-4S ferredoxin iron-sulfur binding domain protein [Synergistales bacterium 58_81]|nr:MAG: 4Fe-4S ferredoxin iron-sulfur binding domain protein [Synergistales bacterium 57_84]KUK87762.1 MAG: 4Fe-4S ferredoxin iron-sulfur binding domain protein [Synergistales bacterium 58_81]
MPIKPLTVAIASGKGGTGKSCVAASLMVSVPGLMAVDADVEEPNLSILLGAEPYASSLVETLWPVIDSDKCDRCGECVRACRFGALYMFGKAFPTPNDLCHGCGVCSMVCPGDAISETGRPVGEIRLCRAGGMTLFEGRLNVGMPNPIPVIKATLDAALAEGRDMVIDCPPGTSCPMVAAVREADMVVLVTEPTPFGIADLDLALQVVTDLKKPSVIVVNRADLGDSDIDALAGKYGTRVEVRLPFSRAVAESYARGKPPASVDYQWKEAMIAIWETAKKAAGR